MDACAQAASVWATQFNFSILIFGSKEPLSMRKLKSDVSTPNAPIKYLNHWRISDTNATEFFLSYEYKLKHWSISSISVMKNVCIVAKHNSMEYLKNVIELKWLESWNILCSPFSMPMFIHYSVHGNDCRAEIRIGDATLAILCDPKHGKHLN